MAHAALCRVAFTQAVASNVVGRTSRASVRSYVPVSLISSFGGCRLGLRPVARSGRKPVGVVMAEGPSASETADEEAFVAEKKAKIAAKKAAKEEGEKQPKPPKTPEEKAAYKARLRRKRLDRKRKLRKLGRWPPLKANVDQPTNPRKRVQRKSK